MATVKVVFGLLLLAVIAVLLIGLIVSVWRRDSGESSDERQRRIDLEEAYMEGYDSLPDAENPYPPSCELAWEWNDGRIDKKGGSPPRPDPFMTKGDDLDIS